MAHVYLKCAKCGSPDFEVIKGRGVWLSTIKGERDE
jgi:hydrogenase nickel incorporation protein HypA/HybF